MSGSVQWAVLVAALGSGLMAGVWFAFSGFVMAGLGQLPPSQGIASMQAINRTAVRPPLMTTLFGTAVLCLGLAVWAALSWGDRRAPWVLAAGALYLLGTIGVTIAGNVPLNDRLAASDPDAAEAGSEWAHYLSAWTAWNHVRGISSLAAAALFTVALVE